MMKKILIILAFLLTSLASGFSQQSIGVEDLYLKNRIIGFITPYDTLIAPDTVNSGWIFTNVRYAFDSLDAVPFKQLGFETDTSSNFVWLVNLNDSVGIGTLTPTAKFDNTGVSRLRDTVVMNTLELAAADTTYKALVNVNDTTKYINLLQGISSNTVVISEASHDTTFLDGTEDYITRWETDSTLSIGVGRDDSTNVSFNTPIVSDHLITAKSSADTVTLYTENNSTGANNIGLLAKSSAAGTIGFGVYSISETHGTNYSFWGEGGRLYNKDNAAIGTQTPTATTSLYIQSAVNALGVYNLNTNASGNITGFRTDLTGNATQAIGVSATLTGAVTNNNVAAEFSSSGAGGLNYGLRITGGITDIQHSTNHQILDVNNNNNYDFDDTEYTAVAYADAGPTTIYLPDATDSGMKGRVYVVKAADITSGVTIKSRGGNIDGTAAATGISVASQYDSYMFQCDGTQWWIIAKF